MHQSASLHVTKASSYGYAKGTVNTDLRRRFADQITVDRTEAYCDFLSDKKKKKICRGTSVIKFVRLRTLWCEVS